MDQPRVNGTAPRTISRGTAADRIADDLRSRIVAGEIPRGSKLPTERELCASYGVSAITLRAALRSLATMNLIEVRHGVGSFVTVATDDLVAEAMRSLIQLDHITATEILSVLGAMNGFAAELAAGRASDADIDRMDALLDDVENGTSIRAVTESLGEFLDALARASGNPLLVSLCRFLSGLQISLARELAGGSFGDWQRLTRHLAVQRREIVRAIRARDADAARGAAVAYHSSTSTMIASLPGRSQTPSTARPSDFFSALLLDSAS